MRMISLVARSGAVMGLLLVLPGTVEAGPPLICHPFQTGSASLLPWGPGPGWNTPDPDYDIRRLPGDTLRLLSADTPVLSRMEVLRRATIYASNEPRVAYELLSKVLGRALDAAITGTRDAHAWFDAGYLVESYRQASHIPRGDMLSGRERESWNMRTAPVEIDGYGLLRKAIELAGPNAEMEFAASLMSQGAMSAEHRRRALAGARAGSMLARNLER